MLKIRDYFLKRIDIILLFFFCVVAFSYFVEHVHTDITRHIEHIIEINSNNNSYPANFLFYFIVNLLSVFSLKSILLHQITIVLLSIAAVVKYVISKKIISNIIITDSNKSYRTQISLIALGLFFCFAIPDPYSVFVLEKMYLGRIVPMVWHNTTTILLFPFAILLFWKQLKILDPSYKTPFKEIIIINILVIINILLKPSFIFVYAPVTFFFLLNRLKRDNLKDFIINLTPLLTSALLVLTQYYLTYALQLGSFQDDPSGVFISRPFKAISYFIPFRYIPVALLLSFTLPILTVFAYREILKYKPFYYAAALTAAGLIISAFIMESGPRMYDGNFLWQNVICVYLLFLSTVLFLTPKFLDRSTRTFKDKFLFYVFIVHSISGILYLIKIFLTHSYY